MSEADYTQALREHSPAAQKAWECAQQAAKAAKEARAYARQLEAEANQVPPGDDAAAAIVQESVQQAMSHAATAELAAAHAQALWEQMVADYQQEEQRRQELQQAQAAALAAVEAAKANQQQSHAKLQQQQQKSLNQQFSSLREDADQALCQAKELEIQATQAASQATATKNKLQQTSQQKEELSQQQQELLVTAKQREKELTQAKTQLKKAQKHLLTVQRQHQSYRQQLEQAKQAVSQTQQEVESQEAALAQAKKQTAAQQRTLNQALERLSRLETASENTRQEEAQAEAAYQLAQQQFQQKEQALLTLLESRAANQKEMATLEEALTETQQKLVEAQQQAAVLAAEFAAVASLATQKDRAAGQLNAKLQTFATATEEVAADPLPAVSTELPPRPQRPPSQPAPTATAETASPAGSKPLAADEAATATSPRPERKPLSKLQPQETAAPSKSSKGKLLGSYLLCILAALALALLVRNFLFQVTQVSGASMEPTLHTEERLFTSKIAYWGSATPQRGDIVIVEDPSGLGEPPYVKRVIAIAGDHLVIREGQVYINDQLFVEPYLPADTETWGEVDTIIPAGCIFIMGDNRQESRDSRDPTISFVPVTKVAGKVLWVLYPFDEWGSVYETATASL